MGYEDFIYKMRNMSPMGRHFTSAALGLGAFGILAWSGIGILSLPLSLGGSIVVSHYSDPTSGNVGSLPISKDSLKNVAAFFGAWMGAPYLLGAMMSAAYAAEPEVALNDTHQSVIEDAAISRQSHKSFDVSDLNHPVIKLQPA